MKVGALLLLLLIGVGLYLYLEANSAQATLKAAKPVRAVAEEVSGVGMKDSFAIEPVEANGKVSALEITKLDPAGPLAKMYDVKVGDKIVGIGPFTPRDTDVEMLEAQLLESGQRQHVLTVLRDGQKLRLSNHGAASGKKDDRAPGSNLNPLNMP